MGAEDDDVMKGYLCVSSANACIPLLLAIATLAPLTVNYDSGEAAWLPGCTPDPAGSLTNSICRTQRLAQGCARDPSQPKRFGQSWGFCWLLGKEELSLFWNGRNDRCLVGLGAFCGVRTFLRLNHIEQDQETSETQSEGPLSLALLGPFMYVSKAIPNFD